jgi:hypothetical protein
MSSIANTKIAKGGIKTDKAMEISRFLSFNYDAPSGFAALRDIGAD